MVVPVVGDDCGAEGPGGVHTRTRVLDLQKH